MSTRSQRGTSSLNRPLVPLKEHWVTQKAQVTAQPGWRYRPGRAGGTPAGPR